MCPVSASDEQQIERMYEMLDTHQKRTAAAAAVPPSARRDTRTDSDAGAPCTHVFIYVHLYTVSQKNCANLFF